MVWDGRWESIGDQAATETKTPCSDREAEDSGRFKKKCACFRPRTRWLHCIKVCSQVAGGCVGQSGSVCSGIWILPLYDAAKGQMHVMLQQGTKSMIFAVLSLLHDAAESESPQCKMQLRVKFHRLKSSQSKNFGSLPRPGQLQNPIPGTSESYMKKLSELTISFWFYAALCSGESNFKFK